MNIIKITLNKISLDIDCNSLVCEQCKDYLLGLDYEINSVDVIMILEGLEGVIDISFSDYQTVALNLSGKAFILGLWKYIELGLERLIYCPVPQQMSRKIIYFGFFCVIKLHIFLVYIFLILRLLSNN